MSWTSLSDPAQANCKITHGSTSIHTTVSSWTENNSTASQWGCRETLKCPFWKSGGWRIPHTRLKVQKHAYMLRICIMEAKTHPALTQILLLTVSIPLWASGASSDAASSRMILHVTKLTSSLTRRNEGADDSVLNLKHNPEIILQLIWLDTLALKWQ